MTKNYDHRQNRGARSSYRGPRKDAEHLKKRFFRWRLLERGSFFWRPYQQSQSLILKEKELPKRRNPRPLIQNRH